MNVKLKILSTAVIFFSGQTLLFAQQKKSDSTKETKIEEVVVVGYGTQLRSKVTASVDQVSNSAFKGRPNTNVMSSLQGKAPNLIIQQTSNEPGAGVNLNVRGVSTFGNNSPLVVIDGVLGDLQSINPNDIESVSVLKDAGSAAIYGSRSANGVVLITTKKGRKNTKMTVTLNTVSGYNFPHFYVEPVHGYENAILRNEAAFNSGASGVPFTADQIREYKERGDYQWWAKEILRPALQGNHNLTISGGTANTTYMVSLGYSNQESNFVGRWKGAQLYNYRINLTNEFGRLKLTSNIALAKRLRNESSSGTDGLMVDAFRVPVMYKQKDELGRYLTNDVAREFNSLGILEKGGYRNHDVNDFFANINAEYKLTDWLKTKFVFGAHLLDYNRTFLEQTVHFYPIGVSGQDRNAEDYYSKSQEITGQLMLEFNKTFKSHHVNSLIGISNESPRWTSFSLNRKYVDPDLGKNISQTEIRGNSSIGNGTPSALNSLFGRTSYDYNNKYFAEFTFRYDGSSKFKKDKRWGFFPSASLGYKISSEDFMQNYAEKVGNLKLRASYGVLGNQNVGDFQYLTSYFIFDNAYAFDNHPVSGTGTSWGNPDITWEKSHSFNVGLDADFFKGALSIRADYFNKLTKDILLSIQTPAPFGGDLPNTNRGEMRNQGWELSATYNHNGEKFKHSVTANIADSKNEVIKFGPQEIGNIAEVKSIIKEGVPIRSYYGLQRQGIFQNEEEIKGAAIPSGLTVVPGDNRYVDQNKDGVIDDNDRVVLGNAFPRYTFGLTYDVQYKNFDFSVFFQGVGKRNMFIRGELVEPFHENFSGNMFRHQMDYWTPQNPGAYYPRLANDRTMSIENNFNRGSDMYIFNAAYVRLKNVQLGYTLPKSVLESLKIQNLRLYLTGQNLLTWSKVKFVDPEVTEFNNNMGASGGSSGRVYPSLIYGGFGLDITF